MGRWSTAGNSTLPVALATPSPEECAAHPTLGWNPERAVRLAAVRSVQGARPTERRPRSPAANPSGGVHLCWQRTQLLVLRSWRLVANAGWPAAPQPAAKSFTVGEGIRYALACYSAAGSFFGKSSRGQGGC
jgi:hypothetical protein